MCVEYFLWLHAYSLSHVQLFCDPVDCSPPGPSVHGISQERILEWVASLLLQRWNPSLLHWQKDSLPLSHLGSPSTFCTSLYLSFPSCPVD